MSSGLSFDQESVSSRPAATDSLLSVVTLEGVPANVQFFIGMDGNIPAPPFVVARSRHLGESDGNMVQYLCNALLVLNCKSFAMSLAPFVIGNRHE